MDKLELLDVNDRQREALTVGAYHPNKPVDGDGRMLAALRRKGLLNSANRITELGRYQVRWYADDCAAFWSVQTSTWHQYVKRGTAPPATAKGAFGSSVNRPWWDPRVVLEFKRPTMAYRAGQRRELDMVTIVRQVRENPKISMRALAAQHGCAPSTLIARLEEIGERPLTSASRNYTYGRDDAS